MKTHEKEFSAIRYAIENNVMRAACWRVLTVFCVFFESAKKCGTFFSYRVENSNGERHEIGVKLIAWVAIVGFEYRRERK